MKAILSRANVLIEFGFYSRSRSMQPKKLADVVILLMALIAWIGAISSDSARAAAPPQLNAQAASEHAEAIAAARAGFAKASEIARVEGEKQLAAAKTALDAATKEANDSYRAKLEAELEREVKAGNERAAEAIRLQINLVVNGPPRTEVQKLWMSSYAAEAEKDYEGAIAAIKKLIILADVGKNCFVQMRLGWLHYLDGDFEEGAAAYRRSAALAPGAITPRIGLLNCYQALNRIDESLETANSILKIDPLNYRAHKTLGDLYYVREDYARASSHYLRLTAAYPDDLQIATSVGWCYLKLGEKELAAQIFVDVLAIQPENIAANSGISAASPEPALSSTKTQLQEPDDRITIQNPSSAKQTIEYTLNGQYRVALSPGMEQTLETNRTWKIRFDQGNGKQFDERLQAGRYEFRADNKVIRLRSR